MQIGDVKCTISSGEFFIVPARTSHSYAANKDNEWTIYWLHFKGKVFDKITSLLVKELCADRRFQSLKDSEGFAIFTVYHGPIMKLRITWALRIRIAFRGCSKN